MNEWTAMRHDSFLWSTLDSISNLHSDYYSISAWVEALNGQHDTKAAIATTITTLWNLFENVSEACDDGIVVMFNVTVINELDENTSAACAILKLFD